MDPRLGDRAQQEVDFERGEINLTQIRILENKVDEVWVRGPADTQEKLFLLPHARQLLKALHTLKTQGKLNGLTVEQAFIGYVLLKAKTEDPRDGTFKVLADQFGRNFEGNKEELLMIEEKMTPEKITITEIETEAEINES